MSASRPRVLVIDDEPQIHRFLAPALDAAGFEVERAATAAAGLRALALRAPDAVLLDLGLPDLDGSEVLVRARAFYTGPIVILSARGREAEKIDALDAGADDYVEKPFGVGELLARLRVVLRRTPASGAPSEPVIEAGDLVIDLEDRRVTKHGAPVRLSPKEYELLVALARSAGRVVTHRQLLTSIWGVAHAHDLAYLRVFVGQLRKALEDDPSTPRLIMTEPGVGYRFFRRSP